ncbi:MAG: P1 family peptidase [Pyrinomonadaceae bacterium]|nr:P1 family peptidase [Pyrinomonadaceae bacterium]
MNNESRLSARGSEALSKLVSKVVRHLALGLLLVAAAAISSPAQTRPRGRDLGIPFPGQTGPMNAITDVAGVAVGHVTRIEGDGKLVPGKGPIRTGVTSILPRPRGNWDPVFAATYNQNGNGDMTGINWIKESGFMEGPILLTGTHSVGTVRDAVIQWQVKNGREFVFTYPIVAETFDFMNDANGEHVKAAHAFEALDRAKLGRVEEGAVGGGTGMGCNGFKGGIGTSSRVLTVAQGGYTVGVLVQCNYGGDLRILGVPILPEITDLGTCTVLPQPLSRPWTSFVPPCPSSAAAGRGARSNIRGHGSGDGNAWDHEGRGSIIVIVATDAPLLPHQLERIARRVSLGMGRLGSFAGNSSGDLFLAFSTANAGAAKPDGTPSLVMLPNDRIDPLFQATIDATEEAVVNAMLAAQTMTGADGIRVFGLPGDRVVAALKKYNRMK